MNDFETVRDYLYALKNRGSKFGIERMREFVAALDHPERKFPVIHVAGTNGKGSVCAMLEGLYQANGYRTGLFTSPHLVHLGERVQVNREPLTEEGICHYLHTLRPAAEALGEQDPDRHPTFFEFITAMAFLRFASEAVDIALVETGLGGRLDASNVVDPELSIITSISYDHMEMLGDTLAKIAGEKAGIIKPGKPVLMGRLPPEAEAVIRATAAERGCACYSVSERFSEENLPHTNLAGNFQRWNAAVAVYATELLTARFPIESTQALEAINWPGRWQQIDVAGRKLILDATHNPEGAEALRENLGRLVAAEGKKPIVVAGTLGEERARSLMAALAPYAREFYLVTPAQERATPTAYLANCLPKDAALPLHHSTVATLFQKRELKVGSPGDTVVVSGSIYLIGEVLERLGGRSGSGADFQDRMPGP